MINIPLKYVYTVNILCLKDQVKNQSKIANSDKSKSLKPSSLKYLMLGEKRGKIYQI